MLLKADIALLKFGSTTVGVYKFPYAILKMWLMVIASAVKIDALAASLIEMVELGVTTAYPAHISVLSPFDFIATRSFLNISSSQW